VVRSEREDPGTPTAFGNAMKAKGFESHKSNGRMQWHGIGLADDDSGEGGEGLCQYSRARIAQTLQRSLPSPDHRVIRSYMGKSGTGRGG
jgi:hypothetical protein